MCALAMILLIPTLMSLLFTLSPKSKSQEFSLTPLFAHLPCSSLSPLQISCSSSPPHLPPLHVLGLDFPHVSYVTISYTLPTTHLPPPLHFPTATRVTFLKQQQKKPT